MHCFRLLTGRFALSLLRIAGVCYHQASSAWSIVMADQEHCHKLSDGPDAWNAWRIACPNTKVDLSGATISIPSKELGKFNFSRVDFSRAVFSDIVIRQANFTQAIFRNTQFQSGVILDDCDFQDAI